MAFRLSDRHDLGLFTLLLPGAHIRQQLSDYFILLILCFIDTMMAMAMTDLVQDARPAHQGGGVAYR